MTSAVLEVYVPDAGFDDLYAILYGQDDDNAAAFTTTAFDISIRPRTSASTLVAQSSLGLGWYRINVTGLVQEIVNRPGWASGNALALLFTVAGTPVDYECPVSDVFNGFPSQTARLLINYSALIGDHDTGQVLDQFDTRSSFNDVTLFRFSLTNPHDQHRDREPDRLPVVGHQRDDGKLSDLKIKDNTATVATGGVANAPDGTGGHASSSFTLPPRFTLNFALTADVSGLVTGNALPRSPSVPGT